MRSRLETATTIFPALEDRKSLHFLFSGHFVGTGANRICADRHRFQFVISTGPAECLSSPCTSIWSPPLPSFPSSSRPFPDSKHRQRLQFREATHERDGPTRLHTRKL